MPIRSMPNQITPLAKASSSVTPVTAAVRGGRSRRAGFSLIEILIVIGVIMTLLAIGMYGYRSLEDSASRKLTVTALGSANSLLKEMNSTGTYARIEGPSDQTPPPFYVLGATVASPGDVTVAKNGRALIVADNPAINTPSQPRLMRILRANPKIATMIAGFPSQSLLSPDPGQTTRTIPILCDAWDNPLLLVPAAGLTGVTIDGKAVPTITSSGQAATNPANRAFWASAGPDGDFTKGDDNLYSFQN